MSNQKNLNMSSILTMLIDTNKRLNQIESVLKLNSDKLNLIGLENINDSQCTLKYYDDLDLVDDYLDIVPIKTNIITTEYESSDDGKEFIMEDSYDSDTDILIERTEVFPEPKLLTPLQIQLANEEFMRYKFSNHSENDIENEMKKDNYNEYEFEF